ncbi:MAG: DEAD/DEAH box helicase, partial [Candidatus Ozemobacteraceae bacterium]
MTSEAPVVIKFSDLDLIEPLQKALEKVGYEAPTPIQAKLIPFMLAGRDVLGQAQTGTGKTAAFALPLLSMIDLTLAQPQVLVLAPTRELAIQVAEAFQKYASFMKGFHVLPVYGGQEYGGQLRALSRGVHVVVGTPGRVMDHMERGTLKLGSVKHLVLDEADEMLHMGFKEDVEWILDRTPETRQIALFSATLPLTIKTMARKYLKDPQEIIIKARTTTVEATRQRYWMVSGTHKLDALTRILEAETFEAILIFVRTKQATLELSEKLSARGFAAAALNGDIPQNHRERIVDQLKNGRLNILIATDVAARGLDVERISHVINFDIPYDVEGYIHRIGRTGRAGRSGEAILFVAPRERRMLQSIERATRQTITRMELPTTDVINDKRIASFKQRITDTLEAGELELFRNLVDQYCVENNVEPVEVAAALARLVQGVTPLLLTGQSQPMTCEEEVKPRRASRSPTHRDYVEETSPSSRRETSRDARKPIRRGMDAGASQESYSRPTKRHELAEREEGMTRYRVEVGRCHGVQPGNLVGAIAGETGLDSKFIGRIKLYTDFSTVDLPDDLPEPMLKILKNV